MNFGLRPYWDITICYISAMVNSKIMSRDPLISILQISQK